MENFYRYPLPIRSITQAPWASGIIFLSLNPDSAYTFTSGAINPTTISGQAYFGFVGAISGASSGAYILPFSGALGFYSSGGVLTSYTTPSGYVFTGLAEVSGVPYLIEALGHVFTLSGSTVIGFGQYGSYSSSGYSSVAAISEFAISEFNMTVNQQVLPAIGLVAVNNILYTILSPGSGVGSMTVSSAVTGLVQTPMTMPMALAASGSLLAVCGWSPVSIASGFSAMAFNPSNLLTFVGANPSVSGLTTWSSDASGNWSFGTLTSGAGNTQGLAWVSGANTLLAADPTSGVVRVYTYSFGSLSLAQTLVVSGATAIAITSNGSNALVCSPGANTITPLTVSGSGWAVSGSVSLANPLSLVMSNNTQAFVGYASGVSKLTLSGGAWSASGVLSLPFPVSAIGLDTTGNIIAAGVSGASGFIYTQGSTGTFPDGADGILYQQGQYFISDPSNSYIHVFGLVAGTLIETGGMSVPAGIAGLYTDGTSIYAPATASTSIYYLSAPSTLSPRRAGEVSVYNGSSWASTLLKEGQQPTAITFDPSGNVTATTLENYIYTISFSGGVISSGVVTQFSGQPQSTPLGLSSLLWQSGKLFGTSSLNEVYAELV